MSDMVEVFRAMDQHDRERKARNLVGAFDDGNWVKHNDYHWTRMLQGKQLQYWPSTNKFQHGNGKVQFGGIEGYIRNRS